MDIYKISSVQSKKLFFLPVVAQLSLDETGDIVRNIDYPEEAPEEFRLQIDTAVSNKLKRPLGLQQRFMEEFVERFEDKLFAQFLSKKAFDFARYVRNVFVDKSVGYGGTTLPVLGNLYMPRNKALLVDWVAASFSGQREGTRDSQHFSSSIVWLAPDYSFWGRSSLLDEVIGEVEAKFPKPVRPSKTVADRVHLLYPSTSDGVRYATNQFRGTKEKALHFYQGDCMGGRVEVFFLPTKFACVLFHFSPPGNSEALVPIGFITRDPQLIKEAQVVIMEAVAQKGSYLGPAVFRADDRPKTLPEFTDHFGFINYCAA